MVFDSREIKISQIPGNLEREFPGMKPSEKMELEKKLLTSHKIRCEKSRLHLLGYL